MFYLQRLLVQSPVGADPQLFGRFAHFPNLKDFQCFDDLIFEIVLEINGFYVFHHCLDGSGLAKV